MKRTFVALFLFVVFLAVTSVTVLPAQAAEEAPAVTLSGWGFTVETFDEDATAYSNRQYVWKNVPEALKGWQFAQKDGAPGPSSKPYRTATATCTSPRARNKKG